jgi:hypothetical protein
MNKDRRMNTYLAHAEANALDDAQGRFAAPERRPTIVGAKAEISYPAQPEGSPWAKEPIGLEPPIGVEIDAHDPVGEQFEIEASTAMGSSSGDVITPEGVGTDTGKPAVIRRGFRRL